MPAAALIAVLLLTWFVYQPGLRGGFLFDDFGTLPKIADRGDLRSFDDAKHFVLGGIAGPTGRPIALGSFLIDDDGWPSDPSRFKRTNLFLHLICGLLIAWLALLCLRALQRSEQEATLASVLAAATWLLHPLLVSTTLYVVQRMTILAALFALCGLILHVRLRLALATAQRPIGLLFAMAAQLSLFTLLAFFSKENGALLPVLAGVLEATVLAQLSGGPRPALFRSWRLAVLGLPALFICVYLAYTGVHFGPQGQAYRGYTIAQRVLTEGRVLASYLDGLVLPRIETTGLYHDDLIKSTGLFNPPTTLLSWLLIAALIASAWRQRRAWPIFSCAILFFFAGQLLESTTVPLELYFEHRNYLPAAFLAIAGAAALSRLKNPTGALAAAIGVVAVLATLTFQRASLWADTDAMLLFWSQKQPASERTQLGAAQVYLRHGTAELGLRTLDQGLAGHPHSVPLLTVKLRTLCAMRRDARSDIDQLIAALRVAPYGPNTYRAMEFLFLGSSTRECVSMNADDWKRMADALRSNDSVMQSATAQQQAYFFQGLAQMRIGQPDEAATAFSRALDASYEYDAGMRMVAELGTCGYPRSALGVLDTVAQREQAAGLRPERATDIADLREALREDLSAGMKPSCGR